MQQSEFTSSLSRSGFYVFLGKLIRFGLQYATQILLINFLCPDDFGLMRYVTIILGIGILIAEFGLGTAIVQKQGITQDEINSSFIVSIVWGVVLFGIIYTLSPMVGRFFNEKRLTLLLRVAALVIPLGAMNAIPRAVLQKNLRFGKLSIIESIAALLSSSVMIVMAFKGYGTWSLVAGSVLLEVVSMVLLITFLEMPVIRINVFIMQRSFFFFGAGIIFQRIISYLAYGTAFFVVGKFFSASVLGIFGIAFDLAILPQRIISAVLGAVVISSFSRIQDDPQRMRNEFDKLLQFSSIITFPALVLMGVLSQEIISVICFIRKTDDWLPAAEILKWLTLVGVVYVISVFPNGLWLAKGKVKEGGLFDLSMLISQIIAVFSGIHWGYKGVVIALCIRGFAVMPFFLYVNYRLTGISTQSYMKSLLPAGVCGIIMIIPVLIVTSLIPGTSLTRNFMVLCSAAFFGCVVYIFVLITFFKNSFTIVRSFFRLGKGAVAEGTPVIES